jgi:hypothetical protein
VSPRDACTSCPNSTFGKITDALAFQFGIVAILDLNSCRCMVPRFLVNLVDCDRGSCAVVKKSSPKSSPQMSPQRSRSAFVNHDESLGSGEQMLLAMVLGL